jgi:cobalamin synthase
MKTFPCVMAVIAAIITIVSIIAKLAGVEPWGVAPRGALTLAAVLLLFGINHSLCRQCIKE